jgi:hypothetical protein
MRRGSLLVYLLFGWMLLLPANSAVWAGGFPATAPLSTTWSDPLYVPQSLTLTHGAMDASGRQLVAVDWNTFPGDDNSRNLLVSTFAGGTWGTPQPVAANGIYSTSLFQDPPRSTFPVFSGNGQRIAYLGYKTEAPNFVLFLIDKTGETWGAPYPLPNGINCVDNDLDISEDGNTVTYSNCPQFFGTMRVYVSRWDGIAWQTPVVVSGVGPTAGGAQPSISADGKKIVYQDADHIFYTELLSNGTWAAPLNLTHCYFNGPYYYLYLPRISPDGNAIFFWRYQKEVGGSTITGKDLYALRRVGGSWSRPVKISGPAVVPTLDNESRPAVNRTGTRVVFNRQMFGDPFTGTRLEMTEYGNGAWTAPQALTGEYKADYPSLTADGLKTAFEQATYSAAGLASISFNSAPPAFSYIAVSAPINTSGGTLTSLTDQTATIFANGSFSQTAQVTYTLTPASGLLPPIGDLGTRGSGFDLSAVATADGMPIQSDPAHPFSIQIAYTGQIGPAMEPTLKLYDWHPDTCLWLEVPSTLDTANKRIGTTAAVRLGWYGLLGETNQIYLPLITR